MSRILNPILLSKLGKYAHDHYGSWSAKPLQILQPVSELAEMDPKSDEYLSLRVELIRARNRVSDALRDATILAETTLEKILPVC